MDHLAFLQPNPTCFKHAICRKRFTTAREISRFAYVLDLSSLYCTKAAKVFYLFFVVFKMRILNQSNRGLKIKPRLDPAMPNSFNFTRVRLVFRSVKSTFFKFNFSYSFLD
jgi:hypothetical protein